MSLIVLLLVGFALVVSAVAFVSYTKLPPIACIAPGFLGLAFLLSPFVPEIPEYRYEHVKLMVDRCSNNEVNHAISESLGKSGRMTLVDYHYVEKAYNRCVMAAGDSLKGDILKAISET